MPLLIPWLTAFLMVLFRKLILILPLLQILVADQNLSSAGNLQLFVNVLTVEMDGRTADKQFLCDFFLSLICEQIGKNLDLPGRKFCQLRVLCLDGNHDDNTYSGTFSFERVISDKDWNDNVIDFVVNKNGDFAKQDSKDQNSKYY